MKTKTLTCEIITPMFTGTAIPGRCELRPPAIKGALRFWWRALNAHKGVDQVRKEEAELFGAADEKLGRSKIQINVPPHKLEPVFPNFVGKGKTFRVTSQSKGKTFEINILDYLAYGCHDYERGRGLYYTRMCFLPKNSFELQVQWDGEEARLALAQSLHALIQYGGLGARSRNGWGKIAIPKLPTELVLDGQPSRVEKKPDFIGFSKAGGLYSCKNSRTRWDEALADVGMIYHNARLALDTVKHSYTNRIMVAQPIIVDKKEVLGTFLERHAKSLFLSVVPDGSQFRGQLLFLPYNFLVGIEDSSLSRKPIATAVPGKKAHYDTVHNNLRAQFNLQMDYRPL